MVAVVRWDSSGSNVDHGCGPRDMPGRLRTELRAARVARRHTLTNTFSFTSRLPPSRPASLPCCSQSPAAAAELPIDWASELAVSLRHGLGAGPVHEAQRQLQRALQVRVGGGVGRGRELGMAAALPVVGSRLGWSGDGGAREGGCVLPDLVPWTPVVWAREGCPRRGVVRVGGALEGRGG